MPSVLQHVRFAFRALGADREAVGFAIVSLALAIAANGTVFSLVQAVEFPRLIYPNAGELVFLESADRSRSLAGLPVSALDALDIAAASRTLRGAAIMADQTSVAGEPGRRARWQGRRVTAAFFDTMGVAALHGRGLSAIDQQGVIVLSHAMWQSLGGDPRLVGGALTLDGGLVTVVGVMPPQFDADADFWTPLGSTAGFARNGGTCQIGVGVNNSRTIGVVFTPGAVGPQTGEIAITASSNGLPGTTNVPVTGTGVAGSSQGIPVLGNLGLLLMLAGLGGAGIVFARRH